MPHILPITSHFSLLIRFPVSSSRRAPFSNSFFIIIILYIFFFFFFFLLFFTLFPVSSSRRAPFPYPFSGPPGAPLRGATNPTHERRSGHAGVCHRPGGGRIQDPSLRASQVPHGYPWLFLLGLRDLDRTATDFVLTFVALYYSLMVSPIATCFVVVLGLITLFSFSRHMFRRPHCLVLRIVGFKG